MDRRWKDIELQNEEDYDEREKRSERATAERI